MDAARDRHQDKPTLRLLVLHDDAEREFDLMLTTVQTNTATRSSTGTASDTARSTNSTTARLAAPSFQLANTAGTHPG